METKTDLRVGGGCVCRRCLLKILPFQESLQSGGVKNLYRAFL